MQRSIATRILRKCVPGRRVMSGLAASLPRFCRMSYPILFKPILHEKVWGGRALEKLGKQLPPGACIGESWELADLPATVPNGRSVIEHGLYAGRTLREAIESDRALIMGSAPLSEDGGFPLLIKFLDAHQNLSVQVHPHAAYVARHPETHLKSEAWYIVDAEPRAVIYKGLRPGIDGEQFIQAIAQGTVPEVLNAVPVSPGECHYLPSGTLHALGQGVVVAEVQTPSDTTFRVYDWGREQGQSPREMHVEQALECMSFAPPPEPSVDDHPIEAGGVRTARLVNCEHFAIERIELIDADRLEIVTNGMPEAWMILAGGCEIPPPDGGAGRPARLELGRTVLFPASMPETHAQFAPGSVLLRITLPSPIEGLLAEA